MDLFSDELGEFDEISLLLILEVALFILLLLDMLTVPERLESLLYGFIYDIKFSFKSNNLTIKSPKKQNKTVNKKILMI
jgi:hypothetical protein